MSVTTDCDTSLLPEGGIESEEQRLIRFRELALKNGLAGVSNQVLIALGSNAVIPPNTYSNEIIARNMIYKLKE